MGSDLMASGRGSIFWMGGDFLVSCIGNAGLL